MKKFYVNKELICSVSPYLRSACLRKSKKDKDVLDLTDSPYDSDDFSIFLSWAVTRDISRAEGLTDPVSLNGKRKPGPDMMVNLGLLWLQLGQLYLFADDLESHDFGNAVMDHMVHSIPTSNKKSDFNGLISPDLVEAMYLMTRPNEAPRKCFVNLVLHNVGLDWVKKSIRQFVPTCPKFVDDLFLAAISQVREACPKKISSSSFCEKYHYHPDRPKSYRCM
jgi:hypothetical protein